MGNMNPLLTMNFNGTTVYAVSLLIDLLDSTSIGETYASFVAGRAQTTLGAWPVHVVNPRGQRFSGMRVFAKCCGFPENDPETIEYGIIVWHQRASQLSINVPSIKSINWSDFAEATDY